MNNKQYKMYVVMLCMTIMPRITYGWGPFAHHMGAPAGLSWYTSLPDYWGTSYEIHWVKNGLVCAEVKRLFAWTHGCQRTGLNGIVPNTPTRYTKPDGVETAECDMYALLNKMTAEHVQREGQTLMLNTAKGFRAHNILDYYAHFSIFPGGELEAWALHSLLEEYFDHVLFSYTVGFGNPFVMNATGHGGIMTLAQKCHRKNGQKVDQDNTVSCDATPQPAVVDTRAVNDQYIMDLNSSVSTIVYTQNKCDAIIDQLDTWYSMNLESRVAFYNGALSAFQTGEIVSQNAMSGNMCAQ